MGGPGFDSWPSRSHNFKLVVETILLKGRHKKYNSTQKLVDLCQNNVNWLDIRRMCLRCVISVRQHNKVVTIPSVTSKDRTDITLNALKGTLNQN